MKKQYSWKKDSWLDGRKLDANEVGYEMEQIDKTYGVVTAEKVVERAEDESNVLHDYFEWNNDKAGHLWRLQQARTLIACVEVTYINEDKTDPVTVRAFVNTKKNEGYQRIEKVVTDIDSYQRLLDKAYDDLRVVRDKYTDLQEIQEKLSFLDE